MTTAGAQLNQDGPRPGFRFRNPLDELVARAEIEALITRRGRAADAKDPEAIVREHVPGSHDAHGIFDGTIEEFAEHLRTHNYSDARYGLQRHTVGNVSIGFLSDTSATAESLHLAFHSLQLPTGRHDVFIGGRYLDRCQHWQGSWRLASRMVVYDWSRSAQATPSPIQEDS